jgi:prepilin-type N-terminal cleavage/methylation domain-containing protein
MRPNQRRQRGFTLPEILVTIAIFSGLTLIVYTMIDQTLHLTMFNESHNDLTIMAQRAVNTMQTEILQTKTTFEEDSIGSAYRAALQLPAAQPQWTTTLLPIIKSDTTSLAPDDGTGTSRYTGNSLLIARQLQPLSIFYDDDGKPGTPDIEFLVDRYRFEYFYLSPNAARSFGGTGFVLDLLQSTSKEYADYFQLSTLTSAQMKLIVPKIISASVAQAWDTTQPVDQAFYDLSKATGGAFGTPLKSPQIAIASTKSLFPGLKGGRISGKMDYSVAFTPDKPVKPFPLRLPIFTFAQADSTIPKFPAGFEVKIVGPAKARKVLTRMLLMSNYRAGTYEAQQGFVISSARF